MNFRQKILTAPAIVVALLWATAAGAQSFVWDLGLDVHFDNHERAALDLPTTRSITFFSVRAVPVVGLEWGEHHSVKAGTNLILDMGARPDNREIEPLLYYGYDSPRYSLYAGKFERRRLIGAYSRSMLSGVGLFYDNVIDGFAMQFHTPLQKAELVLDWDGMALETQRESFRVTSAGEFTPFGARSLRWLVAGYSAELYHLASREGAHDGVVDHITVSPWVGVRLDRSLDWFESLTLQLGWLQGADRDRIADGRWLSPGGLTFDLGVQKWRVGVYNRLYAGLTGPGDGLQMPLYGQYGGRVYKGDPMYASTRRYNYTRVYWSPQIGQGVTLNLEIGLHSDLRHMGFHQIAQVGVRLDSDYFRKKR